MAAPIARIKNRPTSVVVSCEAGAVADNLVYLDPAADESVLVAADNRTPTPVVGIIVSKPTATTAEVVLLGEVSLSIGRGHLYVGSSGEVSLSGTTVSGEYLQRIGFSLGSGRIYFNPSQLRTRRN